MEALAFIFSAISAVTAVVVLILLLKNKNSGSEQVVSGVKNELIPEIRGEISSQQSALRQELTAQTQVSVKNMGDMLLENQRVHSENQSERLARLERRMTDYSLSSEQKLENIRASMEKQLEFVRADNNRQLEEKMNRSFSLVNERLEQVYKGLGEMQNLAVGVGDLKKVLSNVKTRGILGEIQLGSILREILSPEQYEENVATKRGSKNVVEFAVKLPADDNGFVYLPIDSKFPGDTYAALRDAIEEGDKAKIELCSKALTATIKSEAKDIRDKYISPPSTTEFAIMFLPFEGLYSEVVNRGLVEVLQRDYKVNIAGPSTMAALLNSLQMGFKTLAVQKRSAEVWDVLGSVKEEFDKFNDVLVATQTRLDQANKELDKLVGVRTRQIQRKLSGISSAGS